MRAPLLTSRKVFGCRWRRRCVAGGRPSPGTPASRAAGSRPTGSRPAPAPAGRTGTDSLPAQPTLAVTGSAARAERGHRAGTLATATGLTHRHWVRGTGQRGGHRAGTLATATGPTRRQCPRHGQRGHRAGTRKHAITAHWQHQLAAIVTINIQWRINMQSTYQRTLGTVELP